MKKLMLSLLAFIFILSGCSSQELTPVTVVLDYTPNTNHTGLYVAKDKGYYEDEGLDVSIIQPSDGTAEQLVASGNADFGISYEENVLSADNQGMPLVAISSITKHNTSGFLSKEDKNITRPKDMEGKTYCGWGTDVEENLVKQIVKQDGGDPSKVKIQDSGGDFFNSPDECDFFWTFEGWDNIKADMENIDTNYIPLTDYGLDWYTPVIITSQDMIDNNSKTVKKFMDATKKGYIYAANNPSESAEILLDNAPELDSKLVKKSQKYLSENYAVDGDNFGYLDKEIYENFANELKDAGIIDKNLDIESTYTNEFN